MGVYLNPGAGMLQQGRRSQIYVDKSAMLAYLNAQVGTEQKYVCVSRPRRFGKSMAANMVCAYYDRTVDTAAEFAGLAIAGDPSFSEYAGRYDVIRVNMQEFLSATHEVERMLARLQRFVGMDIEDAYPDLRLRDPDDLAQVMSDACAQTGRQFVVVIDEWDCPMREMQDRHDDQRRYLDFLRFWLKDRTYVALCYMTGILPIKKYGTHSALNMFSEFSMTGAYEMAPYVGFTEAEVRSLCGQWGRDFGLCQAWYDGYRLLGPLPKGAHADAERPAYETYAPRSVVRAMETGVFDSYWSHTETYDALRRYIDMDMGGLHERVVELVAGGRVRVNVGSYVNDMTTFSSADDVLTLLVHLGYLGYDAATREVFVPNREVMGEFALSVERSDGWGEVARSIRDSEGLLDALLAGDAKAVADGVERAHEDAASVLTYNDENSLACTLRLALHTATRRWRLVREAPAGKGFADLVMAPLASHPEVPGVVVELKYGATPEDALAQIRERGYARAFGEPAPAAGVLLCGIAYDPKAKEHSALIERA